MVDRGKVYVIDDDAAMRDSLDFLLGSADFHVTLFKSALGFSRRPPQPSTLDALYPTCGCPASMALNF